MSPQTRVPTPGRTVFFLTEFQIDGMLEALRSELVDRVRSFRSMEGSVSGDSLGNYRLSLSVELSDEEGDRLVHQLAVSGIVTKFALFAQFLSSSHDL